MRTNHVSKAENHLKSLIAAAAERDAKLRAEEERRIAEVGRSRRVNQKWNDFQCYSLDDARAEAGGDERDPQRLGEVFRRGLAQRLVEWGRVLREEQFVISLMSGLHEMHDHLTVELGLEVVRTAMRGEVRTVETFLANLGTPNDGIVTTTFGRVLKFLRYDVMKVLLGHVEESAAAEVEVPSAETILAEGSRCYRIGAVSPIVVTEREDCVLQAFLECASLPSTELEKLSGLGRESSRVLRQLTRKYGGVFSPAIRLPGKKSSGGYHVRIRSVR